MAESSLSKLDDKGVFTIVKVENVEKKVGKEIVTEVNIETEEEFEVKSSQKQKNGSLNLLLIGAGVFLLTWGAVNMFRERK